jgi:signal transduction histidine kinase
MGFDESFVSTGAPVLDTPSELVRQSQYFTSNPLFSLILNALPNLVMIINQDRRVVYANQACLDFLNLPDTQSLQGLKAGEIFSCENAVNSVEGCSMTEFCYACGARKALESSLQGRADVQECRIIQCPTGRALDLRVWTTPFQLNNERFTVFAVADVSDEKRRRALERTFFHDILNTAGGLHGLATIMQDASPEEAEEMGGLIYQLAEKLLEEIQSQRQLTAAEANELRPEPSWLHSLNLLQELQVMYATHDTAQHRHVLVDPSAVDIRMFSDRTLLRRVLSNMIKNALEATPEGGAVAMGCHLHQAGHIEFWVHNPTEIPKNIRYQIFQRSFSTKGSGRGLGTYSMKLLSERYLQGTVVFVTSEANGTTFTASYPLVMAGYEERARVQESQAV